MGPINGVEIPSFSSSRWARAAFIKHYHLEEREHSGRTFMEQRGGLENPSEVREELGLCKLQMRRWICKLITLNAWEGFSKESS